MCVSVCVMCVCVCVCVMHVYMQIKTYINKTCKCLIGIQFHTKYNIYNSLHFDTLLYMSKKLINSLTASSKRLTVAAGII